MRRRDVLRGASALGVLGATGCLSMPSQPLAVTEANIERAFLYAYPLYEISRTGQNRAAQPGLNKIGNRATLTDASMRQITAPNNDTIYTSAQLELSGGPVEVIAPTDTQRYFNITFMDAFTDNFAGIGTRLTKGQGGKYWIIGPNWNGATPDGVNIIQSPTNDVWMLGRIVVDGPEDLAAAKALQSQISLRPATETPPRPFKVKCTSPEDPDNFLAVINEMIARSPGSQGHLGEVDLYQNLGIGRDPTFKPSAELIAAWRAYLPNGMAKLREAFQFKELISGGWSYQAPGVGERTASNLTRSAIALGGLAALPEAEAMYFHALYEPGGDRLTGARKYVWRVPPGGIPVDAFWSLTMYQPEDDGRFFLAPNPINRYSIGDRTKGLVKNADGSIDILIQHDQPTGEKAANWLPAPAGPLRLALRAYLPRADIRERKWKAPSLVRA